MKVAGVRLQRLNDYTNYNHAICTVRAFGVSLGDSPVARWQTGLALHLVLEVDLIRGMSFAY